MLYVTRLFYRAGVGPLEICNRNIFVTRNILKCYIMKKYPWKAEAAR